MTKICTKCKFDLPLTDFSKHSGMRDGRSSQCRECNNKLSKLMKQANRLEMYLILGAVCSRCGFSDNRVLSIHHKEGGGNIERDQYSQNSTRFLKVIKSNKDKYELLCANCHLIIERELYASS